MKQSAIIVLIVFGVAILYSAKILIQASANALCDSMDAYYSILGWTLYLVGWILFIGGVAAQEEEQEQENTQIMESRVI